MLLKYVEKLRGLYYNYSESYLEKCVKAGVEGNMQQIELKNLKNDYQMEEAYKKLRTNIEFSGADKRVIVFTSCTANEGKSTVSLSLAMSLAEGGKNVLFIDADLRKSVLLDRYRVYDEVKGLSHFLSGQSSANDIIYKTQFPKLYMIFAGIVPPNPAELLESKGFEALIISAKKAYDYVIIDAPPLGGVIDGAIIAKHSDAAVLVIAANSISYRFARGVKRQLEKSGCPILGAVLNKTNIKQNRYYGKYYGKYYGDY